MYVAVRPGRVRKPGVAPEALPFTLTRYEQKFAEALAAATTEEELAAAYRDHLAPLFAQEMVAGFTEVGTPTGTLGGLPIVKPQYGRAGYAPSRSSTLFKSGDPVALSRVLKIEGDAVVFEILFDQANEDAIAYAHTRVGHLIVNSIEGTRIPIRDEVAWMLGEDLFPGRERPLNVRDLAEPIGHEGSDGKFYEYVRAIPLPERVWRGILDRFDAAVESARLGPPGERRAKLDEALATVRTETERAVYHRSRLIARTEVQFAQNFGRMNGWMSAIADGFIDPERAGKQWKIGPEITRRGKRVCPACLPMRDVIVPIMDPFNTPRFGPVMMPPMHPACRCTAILIPDIERAGGAITTRSPRVGSAATPELAPSPR